MKIRTGFYTIFLFSTIVASPELIRRVIEKTSYEFEKVKDFEAKMSVALKVPGLRMPNKEYKVYFKQPNKFKANTKGFGVLPNTGLYTSPKDNFYNLKNLYIENNFKSDDPGSIMISGTVIADSLKAQFPNEYAKLTFNPTVDVIVDTNQWVIKTVTSRIDTLKLFEIFNDYVTVENQYKLPKKSKVEYFIKDVRLANWLKKDVNNMIGMPESFGSSEKDIIKGMILVKYSDYKVNINLPDRIFKKRPSD